MHHDQLLHRPGERHIEQAQPPGIAAGDGGRLDHHHGVELQALGVGRVEHRHRGR